MHIKRNSKDVTDQEIVDACLKATFMSEAAVTVGLHIRTLTSRAKMLGVYKPGTMKDRQKRAGDATRKILQYSLDDILNGMHPQYPSSLLSKRLVKGGLLLYQCDICKMSNWMGDNITLELDHINGIRSDHAFSNIRLLCPNCHSQTATYKSKNITHGR